jgi:hypothetical protein
MFKYFLLTLSIFSILLSTTAQATPEASAQDCSILAVEGSKVYLRPGTTAHIGEEGIFVSVLGYMLPVRHLSCDEKGIFFDLYTAGWDDIELIPTCPYCGCPLTIFGCLNGSCPSKK